MWQLIFNQWRLLLGSLLLCMSLPALVSAAQCSSRIPGPKQYLIETAANLADKATPEVLRLIDPSTKLPYSDLFQTLAAADQMAQCIRERKYKETLNILTISGGRLIGDRLLENAGFGWIGIAAAPIKYGLYKFLNVAASNALEFNIKAYIQARQAGVSHEQIINKSADCMDDQGWLMPCERKRAGWSPTQHVPAYTPAEVYEFARSIYDAQNKLATLERDKQVVFNNFQEQIGSTKQSTVVRVPKKPETQVVAVLMHDPKIGSTIIYPIAQYSGGRYQQLNGLRPQEFWIYEDQRVIGQFNVTNISRSKFLGCGEPEVGLGKGTFHKSPQPGIEYLALSSKSATNPAPKDSNILEKARVFLTRVARDAFEREISGAMKLKMRTLAGTAPKLEKIASYDLDKNGVPEVIALFSLPMQYDTPSEPQHSVLSQTYTSKATVTTLARFPQGGPPEVLFKWYGCECEYPLNNVTSLIDVVDINNDGKDELVFIHSQGEVTGYLIYEFSGYKPIEVVRSAGYGC